MNRKRTVQEVLWRTLGQSLTFAIPDNPDVVPVRARYGYFIVHRPLKGSGVPRNHWCVTHEPSAKCGGSMPLLRDAEQFAEHLNGLPCDWAALEPQMSSEVKSTVLAFLDAVKGKYK